MAGMVVAKSHAGQQRQDTGGYYDRFRSRLMIPICDLRKRVMAFGGRILGEGEPKYLNSPETPLFNKGRTLYGLERAREAAGRINQLVVVEGYFDAIALHQAGMTNVVATLGTALTPDHVNIIRRFATKVVLLFDPDSAGVRAALRTLDLFVGSGIGVTVVSLPDGQDPDMFVRGHGAEAFARLQERAPSLLDFAVEHSLQNAATGAIDDRVRSVDEILRILQKTGHRIEKEDCLRRVAERLGISQQRLIERYPELLSKQDRMASKQTFASTENRVKRHPEEWDLVHLLLQGQLNGVQIKALQIEAFTVPACRRIVEIALQHVGHDGRVLIQSFLDEAIADSECAASVTELSMSERHFEDIAEYVTGCLETLARKRREQALGDLIVRLRLAEKEGRMDEARRLNAEVNALRLRKAVPSLPAT
jgi:DNA primase